MPDDTKINPPHPNAPEPAGKVQPGSELPRNEIVQLPTGYQKIYLKPLVPGVIAETHLVRNRQFEFSEAAGGCGKPISKIVEWNEEPGSASGS